eukprot:gene8027-biopygen3095
MVHQRLAAAPQRPATAAAEWVGSVGPPEPQGSSPKGGACDGNEVPGPSGITEKHVLYREVRSEADSELSCKSLAALERSECEQRDRPSSRGLGSWGCPPPSLTPDLTECLLAPSPLPPSRNKTRNCRQRSAVPGVWKPLSKGR